MATTRGLAIPCQPLPGYPLPYGTEFDRGWPAENPAAVRLCERYCPIREQCLAEALRQPPRKQQPGVLGGLGLADRVALARLERSRAASRASERRRRTLGKARSPEQQRERYAADPEPYRKNAASYYQAHKAEILAARKARYDANREQILADRRKARAGASAS